MICPFLPYFWLPLHSYNISANETIQMGDEFGGTIDHLQYLKSSSARRSPSTHNSASSCYSLGSRGKILSDNRSRCWPPTVSDLVDRARLTSRREWFDLQSSWIKHPLMYSKFYFLPTGRPMMNIIMGIFLHIHRKFFQISARMWFSLTIFRYSLKEISGSSSGGSSGGISTAGSGAMDTLPTKI